MKRLKMFGTLTLVVLILIVVFQNVQQVETHFLFASVKMPRALLLLVTLLIGFVLGTVFAGKLRKKVATEPQT